MSYKCDGVVHETAQTALHCQPQRLAGHRGETTTATLQSTTASYRPCTCADGKIFVLDLMVESGGELARRTELKSATTHDRIHSREGITWGSSRRISPKDAPTDMRSNHHSRGLRKHAAKGGSSDDSQAAGCCSPIPRLRHTQTWHPSSIASVTRNAQGNFGRPTGPALTVQYDGEGGESNRAHRRYVRHALLIAKRQRRTTRHGEIHNRVCDTNGHGGERRLGLDDSNLGFPLRVDLVPRHAVDGIGYACSVDLAFRIGRFSTAGCVPGLGLLAQTRVCDSRPHMQVVGISEEATRT